MKKAIKTLHLPPREKHCPVSNMGTGLQSMCIDMWLKLVVIKEKIDAHRNHNNDWRMAV